MRNLSLTLLEKIYILTTFSKKYGNSLYMKEQLLNKCENIVAKLEIALSF